MNRGKVKTSIKDHPYVYVSAFVAVGAGGLLLYGLMKHRKNGQKENTEIESAPEFGKWKYGYDVSGAADVDTSSSGSQFKREDSEPLVAVGESAKTAGQVTQSEVENKTEYGASMGAAVLGDVDEAKYGADEKNKEEQPPCTIFLNSHVSKACAITP